MTEESCSKGYAIIKNLARIKHLIYELEVKRPDHDLLDYDIEQGNSFHSYNLIKIDVCRPFDTFKRDLILQLKELSLKLKEELEAL